MSIPNVLTLFVFKKFSSKDDILGFDFICSSGLGILSKELKIAVQR